MKPSRSVMGEDLVPIDVSGFHLGDRGTPAIRTTEGSANAETPLGKIQAVADASANPVIRHPAHVFLVHTPLQHQVFDKTTNRIVSKSRHNRRVHGKTAPESTSYVVFASAFPYAKLTGCRNAIVSGIKSEHDFSEAHQVPHALVFRSDL